MQIKTETTPIRDVVVVKPEVFEDERGFFLEVFREDLFAETGLPSAFVQWDPPMGKLMRVTRGGLFWSPSTSVGDHRPSESGSG